MKVAVVNSLRVAGGGERWVARQLPTWTDAGISPVVYCQPGAPLAQMAQQAGVAVKTVTMRHDLSPSGVAGLIRALRSDRPRVVLCCNERAFRLAAPAARLAGRPVLIYRNGLTGTFKDRAHNRILGRWLDWMVVISEPLRAEMAAYGWIPEKRLRLIRNGVELAAYAPCPAARRRIRRELGCAEDAVVAAVVARVTPDKGQPETLEAFARATRHTGSAELWIVGEGSLRGPLERRAAELGVADRVRFTGYRDDIPAVLQAVDLVVQFSHREGLGNTLLEAMASARPVLASAVGGILDVVEDGITGVLVPPHDVAALEGALRLLLEDAGLRRRMGAAGRGRAQQHFRLEAETEAWRALLLECAPAGSGRAR